MFLGVMGLLMPHDLRRVNALKNLTNLLSNGVGALTFITVELVAHPGAVVPRAALPLAIGAVLGGYFGVKIVRKLPAQVIRGFAGLVGLAIAAWFIVKS
jgi:uncharacterized membrane protein YfcA